MSCFGVCFVTGFERKSMKYVFFGAISILISLSSSFILLGQNPSTTRDSTGASSTLYSSFGISLNANFGPHGAFSMTPIASLNLRHLSAELRYNYEDLRTISGAVGYRFIGDNKVWYEIVPKIAVSVGNFDGISPGISLSTGTGRVAFLADLEYIFALDESNDSYLYGLIAGTVDILPGFYAGINAQRSLIFETSNAVNAGVLVGGYLGSFDLYGLAENFWNSDRYFIIGLSITIDI